MENHLKTNTLGHSVAILARDSGLLDKFKGTYFQTSNGTVYEILGSAEPLAGDFERVYVGCQDYDSNGNPRKVSAIRIFTDCLNDRLAPETFRPHNPQTPHLPHSLPQILMEEDTGPSGIPSLKTPSPFRGDPKKKYLM